MFVDDVKCSSDSLCLYILLPLLNFEHYWPVPIIQLLKRSAVIREEGKVEGGLSSSDPSLSPFYGPPLLSRFVPLTELMQQARTLYFYFS